jgi:AcrR family transcriptional regulator
MAAGAEAFATHGFAGTSVDLIARRARVNKAMIYYHFKSKQRLYVEILRRIFTEMDQRTSAVAASAATPPEKVAGFIAAVNATADARPYLPTLMMREILDGARRLDPDTLRLVSRLPRTLGAILDEGRRAGIFRQTNTLITYFSVIAPLVFFRASDPIRAAMTRHHVIEEAGTLDGGAFLAHLTASTLATLSVEPPATGRAATRRPHRPGVDR